MAKEQEVSVIIDAKNKASRAINDVTDQLKTLGTTSTSSLSLMDKSFTNGLENVKKYTDKLNFMDNIAKKTFKSMGAAAAGYSAISLNSFINLNDGITSVNTLYNQTAYSQSKMYKDSINMYKNIPTDFKQITSGIYNTISAGGDPELAAQYVKKFGRAAVAGDSDMDIVTTAAMGTMNAYKLEAKDLTKVLDLQFMTVKEGITSYSELASSLGTGVLASAKGAGVSLEELQGSIALITKNAIPANIATTSLNQLFNKFTDTNVIKEFKEYGVSIQDANKNTRPLIEIFKDLNYQFDKRKLSSEQRKGFLKELLGSDQAARAITPLIGDMKEFERILDSMNNSKGSMKDAFSDKLESMKVQLSIFKNNIIASGVEQINTLMPFMDKLMEPSIKRIELEMTIDELKESYSNSENYEEQEALLDIIASLQMDLDNFELAPVEELRDALAESVEELTKLNPPLATFLDTVGNFVLNFVGEEGKDNRNTAKNVGKGVVGVYAFKKAVDAFDWINKKLPKFGKENKGKESLSDVLSKTVATMNVKANVVYVNGKLAGGINSAFGKGVNMAVGSAIGSGATIGVGKILQANGYNMLTGGAKKALNGSNQFSLPEPETIINGAKKLTEKEMLQFLAKPKSLVTGVYEPSSYRRKGPEFKADIEKLKAIANNRGHKLPKNDKLTSDIESIKKSLNMTKLPIKDLIDLNKKETLIENKIDLENKISVAAPKVIASVYIDGKNIPVQKINIKSTTEDKYNDVIFRRYGKHR